MILQHVFTALHGMLTGTSDEKAVHLSNAWIVTKRKKDQSRILNHTKEHLA